MSLLPFWPIAIDQLGPTVYKVARGLFICPLLVRAWKDCILFGRLNQKQLLLIPRTLRRPLFSRVLHELPLRKVKVVMWHHLHDGLI